MVQRSSTPHAAAKDLVSAKRGSGAPHANLWMTGGSLSSDNLIYGVIEALSEPSLDPQPEVRGPILGRKLKPQRPLYRYMVPLGHFLKVLITQGSSRLEIKDISSVHSFLLYIEVA